MAWLLCGVLGARNSAASRLVEILSSVSEALSLAETRGVRQLIRDHIQFYPFHPSLYTISDPAGPQGRTPDKLVVTHLLERDELWAERGKAIQSYALLEQSLSMLFSQLSDTTESVAATIFYKITSTAARNAIIEKLLRQKYSAKFNLFWNSYLRLLKPIDIKRNEIVHWIAASISRLDDTGTIICGTILIPPPTSTRSSLPWSTYVKTI